MKRGLLKLIHAISPLLDFLMLPFMVPAAMLMKAYRRIGPKHYPRTTQFLKSYGVFPIRRHFHEPLFHEGDLIGPLNTPRPLPGIDMRIEDQLKLLKDFKYAEEFQDFVAQQQPLSTSASFKIDNNAFVDGDADFLYQFVRLKQPQKVMEIGCGSSTKVIRQALKTNAKVDGVQSSHYCIEPYREPFLDTFPEIEIIRERLETLDIDWSTQLGPGDLLFIDSSHTIRPQGPVLKEFLDVIPQLQPGVLVHVHDIYTPYDYPETVIKRDMYFWNEQYLLEATLSSNDRYRVLAGVNQLRHQHFDSLKAVCPFLQPNKNAGSFYFEVVR